jgi:hypothetical protein
MGEVVNFGRVRKAKAKAEAQARAQGNRAKHGRSKTEKATAAKVATLDERRLAAHRRGRGEDETDK